MTSEELLAGMTAELEKIEVPSEGNPAVALCTRAFVLSYCESRLKGMSHAASIFKGRAAYRLVLPPLTGTRNVRDFIACVTQGMVLNAFESKEATKLLYAAQVAHTSRRTKSKTEKDRSEPRFPAK